jgi:hypothetical protein
MYDLIEAPSRERVNYNMYVIVHDDKGDKLVPQALEVS